MLNSLNNLNFYLSIHQKLLPHKFGIFKHQMQADFGSNVTESLSHIIGEAEERRFGGS